MLMYYRLRASSSWVFCPQPRMHALESAMNEREETIRVVKDRTNRVEDEIFEDFCAQIGVENIR